MSNHWAAVNDGFSDAFGSSVSTHPSYLWSVLHSAQIARYRGIAEISVAELGVAGGNGLIALERSANLASERTGVRIKVFGLDTGAGLPPSQDPRDAPFLMDSGDFPMDEQALRAQLGSAELVLGEISTTVGPLLDSEPPPIGFISFDLDYYTSTRDGLDLLRGDASHCLPRVLCYFDDTLGYPWGEHNGPELAINEFNQQGDDRKLSRIRGLGHLLPARQREARWVDAMYVCHLFDHPDYNEPEGTGLTSRLDLI